MASTPGHEFFGFVIKELERYSRAWYQASRHMEIVSSTGPTFLWSAFLHYRGKPSVALVPPAVWGKCTVCHPQCAEMAGAFFRHLSGGSWHTADSRAINNGILCHPILLMLLGAMLLSALRRRVMWVPLTAILALYVFQDFLDIDMWFAPFVWLMGVGKHGGGVAERARWDLPPAVEAGAGAAASAAKHALAGGAVNSSGATAAGASAAAAPPPLERGY